MTLMYRRDFPPKNPWPTDLTNKIILRLAKNQVFPRCFVFKLQDYICAIGSINSHYFHIIGDKLINPIVGVYIPIIRIPIKGGMTIPNIVTFDHGTYICLFFFQNVSNLFLPPCVKTEMRRPRIQDFGRESFAKHCFL